MWKWSNKNLTFKYGSVYAITIILFVTSAFFIHLLLTDTERQVKVMNQSTENSTRLMEMDLLIQERYSLLGQHIVAPNQHSASNFEETIEAFNRLLTAIEPYIDSENKQFLLNTVLENDAEIIESFNEYAALRESETSDNLNRRTLDNARRNYQQSSFSLEQLRSIFEEERAAAEDATSSSFERTTLILILSILLSVIVGIIILAIVSLDVRKRLKNILGFSEDIENGNLTTEALTVYGEDEFSRISQSLNTMKDGMENILKEITTVSTGINSKSGDLEQSATFLNGVSRNVSNTLKELITIVEEQSAAIVQISSTNNNFNERINSIEQFSAKMKESSLEVSADTKEGISLMNETVNNIDAINESVANSVSKVNVLVERAGDIVQITELITEIAERTNLLALNASIEAARAGDYGKGFAVVADEIRKLSQEVNQSIHNINIITEGIEQEANQVKIVLQSSNEKTINEQKKMEQNIMNLVRTEKSIHTLADNIDNIYTNLSTMTRESDEINTSLEELSNLSNKTTDYITEANQSIHEQNKVIDEINHHSDDLYHAASNLNKAMKQFTVHHSLSNDSDTIIDLHIEEYEVDTSTTDNNENSDEIHEDKMVSNDN
ncbi:methyl-accepting chemotaxis protein [Gracilibacillus halotolerans]|uniref:Methyl-accepting chemotaxis protein n=1 Tax=Gracilibacillus halotolerans TaxID=74386 RepID=A0A841RHE8_9BACI|nr:methyl-accepting chemotaxis protein [Gracilibacillus halotolerans]MBB6512081.1 methyl-accepting chemotaxis protein [Gracilibacillus halotolerans]